MKLFNEGGLRDEGGSIDSESGNDVPIGSMKEEVRDDIPAMVSEGEFVLPADVVRYIGLENLMKIRQEAKMGLKQMEAMGQMGNSEEATMPDDLPFGSSDLIIMSGEPQEMNQGGMATGIGGYQQSVFQNQPQTTAPPIPPSSVAPPPPAASPAGGYMPKFMEAFDDGSLGIKTNTNTGTANTGTTASTSTTEEKKFVPTVGDAYTSIKYINNETGEIRDFYFYEGNPVTPIPAGFVPYDETADAEVTTGTESTATEDTSVRSGGGGSMTIETPEPVDWSTYSPDELKAAYEENKKTRMALTALGLVNPFLAIFGRTTATMQEKKILEEMKAQGVPLPEVDEDSISYKIGSFFSNLFGKDEKEVVKTIRSGAPTKSLRPKGRPEVDENIDGGPAFSTDAFDKVDLSDSERFGFPEAKQIDLSGMGADGARPSVQTDIAAGLGSRGYRSEEDIIEKQRETAREKAAAERRKDRRKEKRKAEAKKAADKRKKAVTKAKSISKSVKGKGAKAISASKSKSSGPFAKGGLASRRK